MADLISPIGNIIKLALEIKKIADNVKANKATWVKEHHQNAVHLLNTLIQELQTYIDMSWDWDKCTQQWTKRVGGAQRNCPIHVLQEYCHPNRSFDPTPSFTEEQFPRKLDVDISKCGVEYGVFRSSYARGGGMARGPAGAPGGSAASGKPDLDSVKRLLSTRTEQFKELAASLGVHQIERPRP